MILLSISSALITRAVPPPSRLSRPARPIVTSCRRLPCRWVISHRICESRRSSLCFSDIAREYWEGNTGIGNQGGGPAQCLYWNPFARLNLQMFVWAHPCSNVLAAAFFATAFFVRRLSPVIFRATGHNSRIRSYILLCCMDAGFSSSL